MSFAYPIDEHRYREQTARQRSHPGVTRPSFRCIACGRRAAMKGCKKTSVGTICASCKEARETRKVMKRVAA
jgi:hypothetical protein